MLHIPILGPALGQLESLSVTRDDPSDFFEIGSRGSNPVPCLPDTLDSTNVTRRVGRRRNGLADLWLKRKGNATPNGPQKRRPRGEFLLWSLSDSIIWPVPAVPLHTERSCRVP